MKLKDLIEKLQRFDSNCDVIGKFKFFLSEVTVSVIDIEYQNEEQKIVIKLD